MPSYQYQCKSCNKEWTEYHGHNESPSFCPFCEQKEFKKIYNFTTIKYTEVVEHKSGGKVGQKTRQFIEESRQELKEQKEQMRGE